MASPFVKYVGGKGSVLPTLLSVVPETFGTYYEPMVGGGALFWKLATEGRITKAVLGDTNFHLIRAYQEIRDNVEELIIKIESALKHYNVSAPVEQTKIYNDTRNLWNRGYHTPDRYIFLKQASFNGLWRHNAEGKLNMAWGKHESINSPTAESLRECSKLLQGVKLVTVDALRITAQARTGDLVFLDPPYFGTFDQYNPAWSSEHTHAQLLGVCSRISNRGVHVLYTNSDHSRIRNLIHAYWRSAEIRPIFQRRSINRDGTGRGEVQDILVLSSSLKDDRQLELPL